MNKVFAMDCFIKITFIALISTLSKSLVAQQILVPYKAGDKYGLSDYNGTIVIQPEYDEITYLGGHYFQFSYKKNITNNSKEKNSQSKTSEIAAVSGVFLNKTKIISNPVLMEYELFKNSMLIGGIESYGKENGLNYMSKTNLMLYNLKGLPLLKKKIDHYVFLGSFGKHLTKYGEKSYFLLRTTDFNNNFSLCIFDVELQKITRTFVEKGSNFKGLYRCIENEDMPLSYNDSNNVRRSMFLKFNSVTNKFEFSTDNRPKEKTQGMGAGSAKGFGDQGNNYGIEKPDEDYEAIYWDNSSKTISGKIYHPFKLNKEGFIEQNFNLIPLDTAAEAIFARTTYYGRPEQTAPLIYKLNGMFGIIYSDNNYSKPVYDTIVYVKNNLIEAPDDQFYYLFGKKDVNTGRLVYGLLNKKGESVIPAVYDSIYTSLPDFSYAGFNNNTLEYNSSTSRILSDSRTPYCRETYRAHLFLCYKNGKCGLISNRNKTVLDLEYDIIYQNSTGRRQSNGIERSFLVLKKDHQFGLIKLNLKDSIFHFVKPVFGSIPVCYFKNYFSQDKLILIKLQGINNEAIYANEKGRIYYREK